MRRHVQRGMAFVLAGALALGFTACGGSSGGQDTETIVVSMWAGSEEDTKAVNEQVKAAQEMYPDIKIEVRTAPWSDYFTKLTTDMSSGNMACVTGMNSGMLSGYVAGFEELTDADLATAGISKSDLAPGSEEILMSDGKLYGLPFDVATMLVYYNEDMLKAAGASLPEADWTFDDFEKIAKDATKDGKYGFAIGMGGFQWQALPIARSGVQPVTTDGKLDLTNPKFVDAATWYAGLVTDQNVAVPPASASDIGWGENQFSGSNAAMAVDGTWNAVSYLNNDSGFTAGMAPLPSGKDGSLSLILGSGYGISKTCKNKEAALKVMGGLLSKQAQDYIASSGRSYPARAESQPLYFDSIDEKHRPMVKAVFEQAFKQVQGQRVTDKWSEIDAYVTPQLVSVYTGQEPMDKMLSNAQERFGN